MRRSELIDLLHFISNYVTFIAAGNPIVIAEGGLSDIKPAVPAPPMEPVKNLALKNGNVSGELVLSFERVLGSKTYIYEITPHPVTAESVCSRKAIHFARLGLPVWYAVRSM